MGWLLLSDDNVIRGGIFHTTFMAPTLKGDKGTLEHLVRRYKPRVPEPAAFLSANHFVQRIFLIPHIAGCIWTLPPL
jgi:hypothetical protein